MEASDKPLTEGMDTVPVLLSLSFAASRRSCSLTRIAPTCVSSKRGLLSESLHRDDGTAHIKKTKTSICSPCTIYGPLGSALTLGSTMLQCKLS